MSTSSSHPLKCIKALTFDVFGTVVDWRTTVQDALQSALTTKLATPDFATLPPGLQQCAQTLASGSGSGEVPPFAPVFAQQWRDTYSKFTRGFRAGGETPWKDVDAHHHDSLVELLDLWELSGLFTPAEVLELSLVWHRLVPWGDAAEGLARLRRGDGGLGLVTATLSNGNRALLRDSVAFGGLGFDRLISAEDFKAYKPDPRTYLGAVEMLDVAAAPGEVAMVAAHLNDLEAARACGLRTIYVERMAEEAWGADEERYAQAREWVDMWVSVDEGGFVEVARRLGELG
ncbi:unnamed protein product [Discula destructiva]